MAQKEYLAGTLRVLILNELAQGPGYGYGIARAIDLATGGELTVRPESLYPVLHRLEAEGLLEAHWEQADGRPRKMYRLTAKGRRRWDKARDGFVRAMNGALKALAEGSAKG